MRLALVVALLAALPAAVACQGDDPPLRSYVALGDSFTAGSGLDRAVASAGGCQQSERSYPHLVAAELDVDLVDASCGGATTDQGAAGQSRPGETDWPPQLSRLDRGTDLVSVGLGYNDLGFFGSLLHCTDLAASDPTGAPCRAATSAALAPSPAQIGQRVVALLTAVHRAAPAARVLLVGYPQLVPASGTCAAMGLAEGDYGYVRELLVQLDDALRAAATEADAEFVDVLSASAGHDVCAGADAWLSGAEPTTAQRAPWHPLAAGQAAVARLVLDTVG